jgi:hypothetical protein
MSIVANNHKAATEEAKKCSVVFAPICGMVIAWTVSKSAIG